MTQQKNIPPPPWKVINNGHGMFSVLASDVSTVITSENVDKLKYIVDAVNEVSELVKWREEATKTIIDAGIIAGEMKAKEIRGDRMIVDLEHQKAVMTAEVKSLTEANVHLVVALRTTGDENEKMKEVLKHFMEAMNNKRSLISVIEEVQPILNQPHDTRRKD